MRFAMIAWPDKADLVLLIANAAVSRNTDCLQSWGALYDNW
jgi:hypothetical protein